MKIIFEEIKDVKPEELESTLKNYFLVYDNMWHLDNIRAAKEDLPLPDTYKSIWKVIKKVIDRLHLKNHANPKCKVTYSPDQLPPGYITQAAEQTFFRLSRFKRIVDSMTQTYHLFYTHRMIKRKHRYTSLCLKSEREPVLPNIPVFFFFLKMMLENLQVIAMCCVYKYIYKWQNNLFC